MVRVQVVLTILFMEMLFIKAVHWNHKPEVRTLFGGGQRRADRIHDAERRESEMNSLRNVSV